MRPVAAEPRGTLGDFLRLWRSDSDDATFAGDLDRANWRKTSQSKSMGLVIDTSALIAWERGIGEIPSGLPVEDFVTIPAIVWAEAMIGVRMAETPTRAVTRRKRLDTLRSALGIQPFTAKAAGHYAEIHSTLSRAGRMIRANDIAVAATARALGGGVLVVPRMKPVFAQCRGPRCVRIACETIGSREIHPIFFFPDFLLTAPWHLLGSRFASKRTKDPGIGADQHRLRGFSPYWRRRSSPANKPM